MNEHALRVCYFGTYRAEYSRNQIMMEGLRRAGCSVIECHEPLWGSVEDRVQMVSGGWRRPAFWLAAAQAYLRLIRRYRRLPEFDVLVAGYPGQLDVPLARLLAWARRKPFAWDIFMSIYLIACERGLEQRSRLGTGLLRGLEALACRLPDRLILDTPDYVGWFGTTHGIASGRFRLVPTGADDRVFRPLPEPAQPPPLRLIYYGTFIRNHGVEYIVEAARLLAAERDIHFELIGAGPERSLAAGLAQRYGLTNLTFRDWMDKSALLARLSDAHVCLGAFGTTPQSLMTVQNKIYEALAMARPVITGDARAVRRELTHGEHVYLCERANPTALAKAVLTLRDDPDLRQRLAANGYRVFCERYTLECNGRRFAGHLRELITSRP